MMPKKKTISLYMDAFINQHRDTVGSKFHQLERNKKWGIPVRAVSFLTFTLLLIVSMNICRVYKRLFSSASLQCVKQQTGGQTCFEVYLHQHRHGQNPPDYMQFIINQISFLHLSLAWVVFDQSLHSTHLLHPFFTIQVFLEHPRDCLVMLFEFFSFQMFPKMHIEVLVLWLLTVSHAKGPLVAIPWIINKPCRAVVHV